MPLGRRLAALALAATSLACGPEPRDVDGRAGPSSVPGAAAAGPCAAASTPIHEIQGDGAAGPLAGRFVRVRGVVVADVQPGDGDATDLGGVFLQTPSGEEDDDPATSEGLFVYAPAAPDVDVGDRVAVAGTATEYDGGTQLADVEAFERCGPGDPPPPVEVTLPADAAALERREGMRIVLPQTLAVADVGELARFGSILLARPAEGLERPYVPTAVLPPGPEAAARAAGQVRARLVLDDGSSRRDPRGPRHPNGRPLSAENVVRVGDAVRSVVGVLDDRYGAYRVHPTAAAEVVRRNPRPVAPAPPAGAVRVAAFNVMNYFVTFGERGAADGAAFERQRGKLVAALAALDAAVVGLVELENDGRAVADLAAALDAARAERRYRAVRTGRLGGDAITVGLLYDASALAPVGPPAVLDDAAFVAPDGVPRNRPALAQAFETAGGATFTVAVAHLKSKGSSCGGGDDDALQGNCNGTRTAAAAVLARWLADDPTGVGDPDVVLVGDLNAYDEEDPIRRLRTGPDGRAGSGDDLIDLLERFGGERVHSYVFDGASGHLDHLLASPSWAAQAVAAAAWPINADESDAFAYDGRLGDPATPYRSSDHDPLVADFEPARAR